MGIRTGNPAWVDSATEVEAQANPGRRITAAKLNAIEAAIDDSAEASHQHDARYVRTVNGTGPDGSGNVVVSGGGSATWDTLAGKPAVIAAGDTAADARTAIGAGTSSFSGAYDDLSGKPTLGTAAATAATDYATATQGAKADAAIPSGLVDAKGDLIVATADGTVTRLPAGSDGHVLTADSAQASGVKWAAAAGGGGGFTVPLQGGKLTGGWAISGSRKTLPITAGQMLAFPLAIHTALTITSAEINVNVASAAGAVRIGIFSMGANATGTLLADFGTLPTSATGTQTLTGLTVSASAGLYWLVAHADEAFTFGRGVSGVFTYGDIGVRSCSDNPLFARLYGARPYAPLPATLPTLTTQLTDNPVTPVLPVFLGAA